MEKQSILRIRDSKRKKEEEKKILNPLLNTEKDEIIGKSKNLKIKRRYTWYIQYMTMLKIRSMCL